MSDVFASALEGQAIAGLITNLKGQIARVRNARELESLVIQMQSAYERRIELLKQSSDFLQKSTDNYKLSTDSYREAAEAHQRASERYKRAAENNYTKGAEYKRLLEEERANNTTLRANLLTALSEGVIYKAVASAARQALNAEPGAKQRTLNTYKHAVIKEVHKGLELIKSRNGDEMYNFAKKYVKWAASQSYLADVSEELNRNFCFAEEGVATPSLSAPTHP